MVKLIKEIKEPSTGKVISKKTVEVAQIKIISIQSEFSVGEIISGSFDDLKIGTKVEIGVTPRVTNLTSKVNTNNNNLIAKIVPCSKSVYSNKVENKSDSDYRNSVNKVSSDTSPTKKNN